MKENYDFRLHAKYADLVLGSGWESDPRFERLSESVARATGIVGDEVYQKAREEALRVADRPYRERPVISCRVSRSYEKNEVAKAQLFLVLTFYQYGAAEEYGTWYTDARPNPDCGSDRQEIRIVSYCPYQSVIEDRKNLTCALGSRQVGPMHYPFGKLTKRDLISLWGGETVISERFAELIEDGGFRGGRIEPIWNTARGAKALPALADTPSGTELIARAELLGMKVSDRQFWSWLESKEQLPAFERALWEEKNLAEDKRPASPAPRGYFQLKVESSPLGVCRR
jgi:hypothetical protein